MVEAAIQIRRPGATSDRSAGRRSTRMRQEPEKGRLGMLTARLLRKYSISLSEHEFENLVAYIHRLVYRTGPDVGREISAKQMPDIDIREQLFVVELLNELKAETGQTFSENDQHSLEIYLAGTRTIGSSFENDCSFVISEQTDGLALEILKLLSADFHMDLLSNSDLRMTLNQHLAPLDVRMRFDIPIQNPLLEDIRKDYPLAYQMGSIAAGVLEKHYKKTVSEDEIGYLALILQLALEKESGRRRYNILIVCSTGKGTSRLLKYKFQELFEACLGEICSCDLLEVSDFDFSKVDYVFSTVPIKAPANVPVIEVSPLLTDADMRRISAVLMDDGRIHAIRKYFGRNRFWAHFPGKNKEELLKELCGRIAAKESVDADFYDQVMERETLAQMDIGNSIALPHPNEIASEKSFAYCVVLDQPVLWNGSDVQVLILASIGREKEDDAERQKFYEAVAGFALDQGAVEALIQNPTYENFEALLT